MMGFFTSKKNEDPNTSFMDNDKSVVQVIRSRFYGKSKGKEREVISSPIIPSLRSPGRHWPEEKLIPVGGKSQGLLKKHSPHTIVPNGIRLLPEKSPSPSQPATDAITQTLAQRLNELAVSNSEGLLNDEEYRLLRRNLFERFASGAVAPSETPLVPLASRSGPEGRLSVSSSTQGRPSSQFHVDRSPSVRKKTSMSSTVSTLFRRASRHQSSSRPGTNGNGNLSSAVSDVSSIFSINSSTSFRRPVLVRTLSRKGSDASIRTETSRKAYDTSFSSRPGSSALDPHSFTGSASRSTTRSLRRLATATPPSSFTARISGTELGQGEKPASPISMQDVFDDQNLQTAQEIRQEIELVEAEGRRLMDAFNGLELSTLTRSRQRPPRLPPLTSPSSDSSRSRDGDGLVWSLMSERKRRGADLDALSVRSNISAGTTLSAAKSQYSSARIRTTPGINKSVSLLRKNSFSSLSSRANSNHGLHPVPPLPLSPSSIQSHLGIGSTSSVNLSRSSSHLPLSALAESEIVDRGSFADTRAGLGLGQADQNDVDIIALEVELADIRKRRGEVTARYETRLEYLRAKLKGAELHEKLLRK